MMTARISMLYFVVSTFLLIAPAYTAWGNRVYPRVFGLPWSLVWVLGIIVANVIVLGCLYRSRRIDHAEDGSVE